MVKNFGIASLNRNDADEANVKLLYCGTCKYTTKSRGNLNKHHKKCKKFLNSKLSRQVKEAVFSVGPSAKPGKMKFVGIGRNPRHAGRKAHMVHQCDACEIVFFDARALAEHKRRKNHKDQE